MQNISLSIIAVRHLYLIAKHNRCPEKWTEINIKYSMGQKVKTGVFFVLMTLTTLYARVCVSRRCKGTMNRFRKLCNAERE